MPTLAFILALIAVILFVLDIFRPDRRLIPAGLAFFAAAFIAVYTVTGGNVHF